MTENIEGGNAKLVAYCGLYCGECGAYKRERCPGCAENDKATWCKIRSCCMDGQLETCAACSQYADDPKNCSKYNNWISRVIGFIFRSDRASCISRIKEIGTEEFAKEMSESKRQSMKRK